MAMNQSLPAASTSRIDFTTSSADDKKFPCSCRYGPKMIVDLNNYATGLVATQRNLPLAADAFTTALELIQMQSKLGNSWVVSNANERDTELSSLSLEARNLLVEMYEQGRCTPHKQHHHAILHPTPCMILKMSSEAAERATITAVSEDSSIFLNDMENNGSTFMRQVRQVTTSIVLNNMAIVRYLMMKENSEETLPALPLFQSAYQESCPPQAEASNERNLRVHKVVLENMLDVYHHDVGCVQEELAPLYEELLASLKEELSQVTLYILLNYPSASCAA